MSRLEEFERECTRGQFMRMLWGLGQLKIIYSHDFFDTLTDVILSEHSQNSGVDRLNLKDIQTVLESVRYFCNQSTFDERLFDALFARIRELDSLTVQNIVSFLRTFRESRYNDPVVLKYVLD